MHKIGYFSYVHLRRRFQVLVYCMFRNFFLAALFALDVNLLGLIVAFFLGFPINVVINSMLQLLTAGILTCLVLSSVLYHLADYVEDWRLNPRGNTGVCPIK